jgi:hypothetical protein
MHPRPGPPASPPAACTRIDLVFTVAALTLVLLAIRPLWASSGPSKSLLCMENLRRLQAAWSLYIEDQSGRLPLNPSIAESLFPVPGRLGWVSGAMSWDLAQHNTNTAYLTEPQNAALAPYAGADATLYKCPEDNYLSPQQAARGWSQRARSYVMNHYLGSTTEYFADYRYFRKLTDLQRLPPRLASVFLEEHPDSINDPLFLNSPTARQWGDIPASFHEGACWFSFADGHLELRRWQSPTTLFPVRFLYPNTTPLKPDDPDWTWVQERASERR